jgi:MFS family permease
MKCHTATTALGLTMVMSEEWLLLPYGISFGLMMSVGAVLGGSVWPNLFGRLHQGAIRGFVFTGMVIGTSIGPLIFGLTFDTFGSYDAVLWIGIVIAGVLTVLAPMVSLPDRQVNLI